MTIESGQYQVGVADSDALNMCRLSHSYGSELWSSRASKSRRGLRGRDPGLAHHMHALQCACSTFLHYMYMYIPLSLTRHHAPLKDHPRLHDFPTPPSTTMAEYWKSTPSYWCKFCETYVKDTPIERKNHESTGKHQGNIQRSLRELHKKQERATRDQQRAKDEVARLNGLVGGKDGTTASASPGPSAAVRSGSKPTSGPAQPTLSAAAQRKAHAEQLVAMGVELPEELKREITGVGGWQTTSEKLVDDGRSRTLAEIKREEEERETSFTPADGMSKGVHKRKIEDEEEARDEEAAPKARKVWGSAIKTYPGSSTAQDAGEDLDALLGGVTAKKEKKVETKPEAEPAEDEAKLYQDSTTKVEPADTTTTADDAVDVKNETTEAAVTAPPAVVFKKRKAKK